MDVKAVLRIGYCNLFRFFSMEVDETVINPPTPKSPPKFRTGEAPKSRPGEVQKSRPEEVRLRQPASRQSPSHKVRPASAYIPSVSTEPKGKNKVII